MIAAVMVLKNIATAIGVCISGNKEVQPGFGVGQLYSPLGEDVGRNKVAKAHCRNSANAA
jgi:hypothetical protein